MADTRDHPDDQHRRAEQIVQTICTQLGLSVGTYQLQGDGGMTVWRAMASGKHGVVAEVDDPDYYRAITRLAAALGIDQGS